MSESDELAALKAENTRLMTLLEAHGIDWRIPAVPDSRPEPAAKTSNLSTGEKLALFRHLAEDVERTRTVAAEVEAAFRQGRKVLVLTERTEHLRAIHTALEGRISPIFLLHGRMSHTQRTAVLGELDDLPPAAPRVLLATGKLVGEGFDHPPLDTLILAMPISWRGTLQQYAGRLHRQQEGKRDVRIIAACRTFRFEPQIDQYLVSCGGAARIPGPELRKDLLEFV